MKQDFIPSPLEIGDALTEPPLIVCTIAGGMVSLVADGVELIITGSTDPVRNGFLGAVMGLGLGASSLFRGEVNETFRK